MTPREEGTVAAGHTKLYLRYCRTHETPRAPEDTRTRGGGGVGREPEGPNAANTLADK